MDLYSFLDKIALYANKIDIGRKGFAVDGEEHAGRIHYEDGISGSLASFREAHASADSRTIVLAEWSFWSRNSSFAMNPTPLPATA
jgi:hypothetical protein